MLLIMHVVLLKRFIFFADGKSIYSSFLFFLTNFCFKRNFNFLMTVALGIVEISDIEDAFIPFWEYVLKGANISQRMFLGPQQFCFLLVLNSL